MYKNKGEIELEASRVRTECKTNTYGILNLFNSVESNLGYKIFRYPFGEKVFLGVSFLYNDEKIIITNSSSILSREIFSLAHEIGHIRLHLSKTKPIFVDKDFIESSDLEEEANYFAACLLMPEEEVRKFIKYELQGKSNKNLSGLDIARFQTTFNVSFEMVINRLKILKIVSLDKFACLKEEKMVKTATSLLKAVDGDTQLNKSTNSRKVPNEFLEWIVTNYQNDLIPFENLKAIFDHFDINSNDIKKDDLVDDEDISFEDVLGGDQ